MRTHPLFAASSHDPLIEWAGRLRSEVLTEMAPSSIGGIAGLAAAGAVSAAMTAAVATAASVAVIEGGTMTSTAIAATAASHVALKLAAGGLAAALTVGGAAAVTGNLPDGAQSFAADAAAHIGLDLPRPDANIGGSLDLSVGDIVTVGGAGRVGVTLDGDGLQLNGIEANAGFSARVVSSTVDTLIVEFESATETTTVFLTSLEGEVMSSITTTLHGSADAATEAEADADASASTDAKADADAAAEADADADAKGEAKGEADAAAEADAEAGFGITVGR